MKLKPDSWLGYSADTDTDDASWRAARRLGCGVDEVEVESNGGAVLVRRKDADYRTNRTSTPETGTLGREISPPLAEVGE